MFSSGSNPEAATTAYLSQSVEEAASNPVKSRFESEDRHQGSLAQLAEAIASEAIQSEFESQGTHHGFGKAGGSGKLSVKQFFRGVVRLHASPPISG